MNMGFRRNHRGIGLIEALIALMILSFGVVSAARIQTVVLDSHCTSKAINGATSALRAESEKIRALTSSAQCPTTVTFSNGSLTRTGTDNYSCTYNAVVQNNTCKSAVQLSFNSIRILLRTSDLFGTSSGSGVTLPSPVVAERITDTTGISAPNGATADGVAVVYNADTKHYVLYAQSTPTGNYFGQIKSNVPFIKISGVAFSDRSNSEITVQKLTASPFSMRIITSSVGYCQFPLRYTNADDPSTYTLQSLPNNTYSAAYTCYLPEGWYGNIGLEYATTSKETKGTKINIRSCPDNPDIPNMLGGTRSVKSVYATSTTQPLTNDSQVIGQTGITAADQSDSTKPLERHHFVVADASVTCAGILPSVFSTAFPSHDGSSSTTLKVQGDGGIKQTQSPGSGCQTSPSCLKPRDYWVKVVGAVTLTGTLSRQSGSAFKWSDVTLLANRNGVSGGVISYECAIDLSGVSSTNQTTAPSVPFSCRLGATESITLSVPASSGITVVSPSSSDLTVNGGALPANLDLVLSGAGITP